MPPEAINADIAALAKLGVTIRCGERVTGDGSAAGLEALLAGHDAVLLALGSGPAADFAATLRLTPEGQIEIDPASRVTSNPKVFGGGGHEADGTAYSPIGSAYDGQPPPPPLTASCKAHR